MADQEQDDEYHYTTPDGRSFSAPKSVPNDDIRKYLAAEGLAPEHIEHTLLSARIKGPDVTAPGPVESALRSAVETVKPYAAAAATGAAKAIPRILGAAASGAAYLGGVDSPAAALSGGKSVQPPPNPNALVDKAGQAIGGWHEAQTPGEKLAEAAGEGAAGGLVTGVGGVLPRATVYGAVPGAASEAAGQATEGMKIPDWVPYAGGKDVEPAARMLASVFSAPLVRKAVTQNTVSDPTRLAANAVVERELPGSQTAGQFLNNPKTMAAERAAEPDINNRQSGEFMRRITRPAGEVASDVTGGAPDSYIDRGLTRASNDIEAIANRSHIDPQVQGNGRTQPQLYNDLTNVAMARPQDIPRVLRIMRNINTNWRPGTTAMPGAEEYHNALFGIGGPTASRTVTGQDYQRLRSALHSAASEAEPNLAHTYRNIADALDTGMENTIKQHNPNDLGAWNSARRQYANMLTMENAAAGAKAGQTRFTPDEIKSATKAVQGTRPYLRGHSENSEFNEAYGKAMPELPAPTNDKSHAAGNLLGLLGMAGAGAGTHFGFGAPWEHSGLYSLVGGEAGRLAGGMDVTRKALKPVTDALRMSRPVQEFQKNQFAPLLPQERDQRINSMLLRALQQAQH